jgi:hypothetical protein
MQNGWWWDRRERTRKTAYCVETATLTTFVSTKNDWPLTVNKKRKEGRRKANIIMGYYSSKNLHFSYIMIYLKENSHHFILLFAIQPMYIPCRLLYNEKQKCRVYLKKSKTKDKKQIITYPKKKWWGKIYIYEILRTENGRNERMEKLTIGRSAIQLCLQ